jgi:hypothetical protein
MSTGIIYEIRINNERFNLLKLKKILVSILFGCKVWRIISNFLYPVPCPLPSAFFYFALRRRVKQRLEKNLDLKKYIDFKEIFEARSIVIHN